jgi:hypothetical protein
MEAARSNRLKQQRREDQQPGQNVLRLVHRTGLMNGNQANWACGRAGIGCSSEAGEILECVEMGFHSHLTLPACVFLLSPHFLPSRICLRAVSVLQGGT